ncbi:universal stress protein [Williamsia muralis]|uniref:Universal stress protein n=1 Tax=Williamsia marianensis TaxID=85044 RepID=A0ABU4EZ81_WILMA|nr:universal stress protein [Williamsia muralis]MDV7136575.1 universal stress protein [Williamsia muralis]
MPTRRPIIVGVSTASSDPAATEWAASEAALRSRALHIVAVADDLDSIAGASPQAADYCHDIERAAQTVLTEARVVARQAAHRVGVPDLAIGTRLLKGSVRDQLIRQSIDADMIVVGIDPATGRGADVVASALATHAHCPVALVPSGWKPAAGRHIVVGLDGSAPSAEAAALAFDEADLRHVPLVAAHSWLDTGGRSAYVAASPNVIDARDAESTLLAEQLAGWCRDYPDVSTTLHTMHADPVDLLTRLGTQAELLIVGSRGLGGFSGMLLGSTSQRLLPKPPCPLIVVRNPNLSSGRIFHRLARSVAR